MKNNNWIANQQSWQDDRVAILSGGKAYSYQQLNAAAEAVATALLNGRSDLAETRVAFMVMPGFDYVATQWGIWLAGGIAVPLCVLHPLEALQYVVDDTAAKIMIVGPEYEELLSDLAKARKMRWIPTAGIQPNRTSQLPGIPPSRRAMILYTSGTTSKPKGVVTTHANIWSKIKTLIDAWEWHQDDYILNVLPLHHVHGIINVVNCALWSGARVAFLPRFDARQVWDFFRKEPLTLFMAVPTIYFKLIAYWEAAGEKERVTLSSAVAKMRLMVSGSAALPVSVLEKWRTISGHILLERYGMTEIGMALSNPYRGERLPGHVVRG